MVELATQGWVISIIALWTVPGAVWQRRGRRKVKEPCAVRRIFEFGANRCEKRLCLHAVPVYHRFYARVRFIEGLSLCEQILLRVHWVALKPLAFLVAPVNVHDSVRNHIFQIKRASIIAGHHEQGLRIVEVVLVVVFFER